MRRFAVVGVAVSIGVLAFAPTGLAASARVAALQIALRAHGFDPGPVDGVRGPLTTSALVRSSAGTGVRPTGRVGRATRRALGTRGRPLLGQRELGSRARSAGTSRCSSSGCAGTGSARARSTAGSRGPRQPRFAVPEPSRARPRRHRGPAHVSRRSRTRAPTYWHVVSPGESFFSIAARYHVSPWRLARRNRDPADERHRPGSAPRASEAARGCGRRRRPGRPRVATPFAPRSTTGRASTASIPSSRVRSRGWSRASSRTSSRTSVRSA